ncbi:MAG: right-handed parallel beta-helix repeat-containing protein [Candidatus Heimdallarchaeaceae archaeon]
MKRITTYRQLGLVLILIATTTFLLYLSTHKEENMVLQSNKITIDSMPGVNSDENRTVKKAYSVHSPILIESDDDLTVFPGLGTKDDPYVIENYNITDSTTHGIKISGTTKYILIHDCYLNGGGSSSSFYGIYIDSTTDGTITVTNNTISNYATGIYLSSCSNNSFTFNIITNSNNDGLYLSSSSNNTFSSNTITNSDDDGITISFSSGNIQIL